jgi:hypothetical protein
MTPLTDIVVLGTASQLTAGSVGIRSENTLPDPHTHP